MTGLAQRSRMAKRGLSRTYVDRQCKSLAPIIPPGNWVTPARLCCLPPVWVCSLSAHCPTIPDHTHRPCSDGSHIVPSWRSEGALMSVTVPDVCQTVPLCQSQCPHVSHCALISVAVPSCQSLCPHVNHCALMSVTQYPDVRLCPKVSLIVPCQSDCALMSD